MRRWITILLLVLLPSQMSWAAVADYCAHEQGAGAEHVGHHDHATHGHDAPAIESAVQANADDSASGDLDCGHCHGQVTDMLESIEAPTLDRAANAHSAAVHLPRAAHAAEEPERPQWLPLA